MKSSFENGSVFGEFTTAVASCTYNFFKQVHHDYYKIGHKYRLSIKILKICCLEKVIMSATFEIELKFALNRKPATLLQVRHELPYCGEEPLDAGLHRRERSEREATGPHRSGVRWEDVTHILALQPTQGLELVDSVLGNGADDRSRDDMVDMANYLPSRLYFGFGWTIFEKKIDRKWKGPQ